MASNKRRHRGKPTAKLNVEELRPLLESKQPELVLTLCKAIDDGFFVDVKLALQQLLQSASDAIATTLDLLVNVTKHPNVSPNLCAIFSPLLTDALLTVRAKPTPEHKA